MASAKILILGQRIDPTIDQMVLLLQAMKVDCIRWQLEDFPARSEIRIHICGQGSHARIQLPGRTVPLDTVRSIWVRQFGAPALPAGLDDQDAAFARREIRSALSGLFGLTGAFWVNHPDANARAASKPMQLRRAVQCGLAIPDTLITNDPQAVRRFHAEHRGAVMFKPFHAGFMPGTNRRAYTTALTLQQLRRIDTIRPTPAIFQQRIEKAVEIRLTIIGRRLFATEIRSRGVPGAEDDWRAADLDRLPHAEHALPADIAEKCLDLTTGLGLNFAALDLIVEPGGRYVFLELNPMGQFGWIEARTGQPLTASLAQMLIAGRPA